MKDPFQEAFLYCRHFSLSSLVLGSIERSITGSGNHCSKITGLSLHKVSPVVVSFKPTTAPILPPLSQKFLHENLHASEASDLSAFLSLVELLVYDPDSTCPEYTLIKVSRPT